MFRTPRMFYRDRRPTRRHSAPAPGPRWCATAVNAVIAALLLTSAAAAQQKQRPPLRVAGMTGGGVRATLTESWGKLDFEVANATATERRLRVLTFFANQPDVQYGRDLWVPAHATARSWLPLGPAPAQGMSSSRELRTLLYDLTGGKNELVLPPGAERERAVGLIYRRREPTTVLLADDPLEEGLPFGKLPAPDSAADEALLLARVARSTRTLSEHVQFASPDALPNWDKLFDGVDHLIVASNRVAQDPGGMRALRRWLEHGGIIWVMLDLVEPDAVAALLGEALNFHLVGRVGLTDFRLDELPTQGVPQQHERPVTLARVTLPPGEKVVSAVQGWPAWFTRDVGRGKVLFTTLGPRGWYRPRRTAPNDAPSPYGNFPKLPVAWDGLVLLTEALQSAPAEAYPAEVFQGALAQEIGYDVIGRGTVASIFALFLGGALGLTMLVRRAGRTQFAGWLAPAGALAATAVLFGLGQASRQAAPPAAAFAQAVHAVDGTHEAAVSGLLAVFRPDSGATEIGARDGGFFALDMAGLEGQTRRFIMTDMDAWHWENLALPAGVRFAPLQFTARAAEPIAAVGHFGPDGLEGKLTTGAFRNPNDALLTAGRARKLALRLRSDGTFSAGPDDALAPDQFLTGALLSDRQQQRQEMYRRILKPATAPRPEQPTLLAWADPADAPFVLPPQTRVAGTALIGIPLTLQRGPAGARATIPGMFMPVRRMLDEKMVIVPYESSQAATIDLRFQLPAVVLPFTPERARLVAKVNARSRRVSVASPADGAFVEHLRVDSPLGPVRADIDEPRLLRPDADGGIHVRLTIGGAELGATAPNASADVDRTWTMEYVELEVTGRTAAP